MGQKVHPIGIRLGISKDWSANWYADKAHYGAYLLSDIKVRAFLTKACKAAAVSSILIERPANNVRITIFSARPGAIIGKKGDEIEFLRRKASAIVKLPVQLSIKEIKKPDLDARLVAEGIAQQLERRAAFRRIIKRTLQTVMRAGAEGVRVRLSGRLGGAEIARAEWAHEGRVPLHTFRANMDYSTAEALTTYGIIGVKVWIYKGEVHSIAHENA